MLRYIDVARTVKNVMLIELHARNNIWSHYVKVAAWVCLPTHVKQQGEVVKLHRKVTISSNAIPCYRFPEQLNCLGVEYFGASSCFAGFKSSAGLDSKFRDTCLAAIFLTEVI